MRRTIAKRRLRHAVERGEMERPQIGSWMQRSGKEVGGVNAIDVERDWLVAHLADEAEYSKARADAIGRALAEVIAGVDAADQRAHSSDSWQLGSSAQLSEDMGFGEDPTIGFFRAALTILIISLVLWALLGLLGFAAYRYFA